MFDLVISEGVTDIQFLIGLFGCSFRQALEDLEHCFACSSHDKKLFPLVAACLKDPVMRVWVAWNCMRTWLPSVTGRTCDNVAVSPEIKLARLPNFGILYLGIHRCTKAIWMEIWAWPWRAWRLRLGRNSEKENARFRQDWSTSTQPVTGLRKDSVEHVGRWTPDESARQIHKSNGFAGTQILVCKSKMVSGAQNSLETSLEQKRL